MWALSRLRRLAVTTQSEEEVTTQTDLTPSQSEQTGQSFDAARSVSELAADDEDLYVARTAEKRAILPLDSNLPSSKLERKCDELLAVLANDGRGCVVNAVRESIRTGYVTQLVDRRAVSSFVDDLESSIALLCDSNYLSICDFAHQSLAFKLELLRLRSRVVTLNNQLRHRGGRTLRQIENSSQMRVERRNLSRVVAVLTHLERCVKLAALAHAHLDSTPPAPLGDVGGGTDYVAVLRLVSAVRALLTSPAASIAAPHAAAGPAGAEEGATTTYTSQCAARTHLGVELMRWAVAAEAKVVRIGEEKLCGDGGKRAGWLQHVAANAMLVGASAMRAEGERAWQHLERVDARSARALGWGERADAASAFAGALPNQHAAAFAPWVAELRRHAVGAAHGEGVEVENTRKRIDAATEPVAPSIAPLLQALRIGTQTRQQDAFEQLYDARFANVLERVPVERRAREDGAVTRASMLCDGDDLEVRYSSCVAQRIAMAMVDPLLARVLGIFLAEKQLPVVCAELPLFRPASIQRRWQQSQTWLCERLRSQWDQHFSDRRDFNDERTYDVEFGDPALVMLQWKQRVVLAARILAAAPVPLNVQELIDVACRGAQDLERGIVDRLFGRSLRVDAGITVTQPTARGDGAIPVEEMRHALPRDSVLVNADGDLVGISKGDGTETVVRTSHVRFALEAGNKLYLRDWGGATVQSRPSLSLRDVRVPMDRVEAVCDALGRVPALAPLLSSHTPIDNVERMAFARVVGLYAVMALRATRLSVAACRVLAMLPELGGSASMRTAMPASAEHTAPWGGVAHCVLTVAEQFKRSTAETFTALVDEEQEDVVLIALAARLGNDVPLFGKVVTQLGRSLITLVPATCLASGFDGSGRAAMASFEGQGLLDEGSAGGGRRRRAARMRDSTHTSRLENFVAALNRNAYASKSMAWIKVKVASFFLNLDLGKRAGKDEQQASALKGGGLISQRSYQSAEEAGVSGGTSCDFARPFVFFVVMLRRMAENVDRQMLCDHAFSCAAVTLRLALSSSADAASITRPQLVALRVEIGALERGYLDALLHEAEHQIALGNADATADDAREELAHLSEVQALLAVLLGGDASIGLYISRRASGDPRGDTIDPTTLSGAIKRCVAARRRVQTDADSVFTATAARQAMDSL